MKRFVALVLSATLLGACATTGPTLYGARTAPDGAGYSEFRLEAGRYRVSFQGRPGASVEQVSDYALLRAAELAVRDGYAWFRVADRETSRDSFGGGGSSVSIGAGSGGYGRRGGLGLSLGTRFDLGPGPTITSSLEVVFGKGLRPNDADVYDAADIIRNVGYGHGRT